MCDDRRYKDQWCHTGGNLILHASYGTDDKVGSLGMSYSADPVYKYDHDSRKRQKIYYHMIVLTEAGGVLYAYMKGCSDKPAYRSHYQ